MAKSKGNTSFSQLRGLLQQQTLVLDMGSHTVKVLDVHKKGEKVSINSFLEIENVDKYFNGKDITNFDGLANDINRVLKVADLKSNVPIVLLLQLYQMSYNPKYAYFG